MFKALGRCTLPKCNAADASGLKIAISLLRRFLSYSNAINASELNERLVSASGHLDSDVVGPIKATVIPGRGRGLVVTQPVKVGDLLLACKPLAFLSNPHGQEQLPDPMFLLEQLFQHKSSIDSSWTSAWLRLLYRGKNHSTAASKANDDEAAQLNAMLSTGQLPNVQNAGTPIGREEAAAVVQYNAFGDKFDDPVASAAGSEESLTDPNVHGSKARLGGHVGLWPHFSLLNHSCLPNAVHYTIGSTMVVRATQLLMPGDEVCVSYLGTEDHAPAAVRKKVLSERFGFTCQCPRCVLEEGLTEEMSSLLQEIHSDVHQNLMPQFTEVVDNGEGLEKVRNGIVKWSQMLYPQLEALVNSDIARDFQPVDRAGRSPLRRAASCSMEEEENLPEVGGPMHAVLCVEAAVYEFYQLVSMHDEASGMDHTASLQNCIQIMDAVSRGSELHTFLSARVLFRELSSSLKKSSPQAGGDMKSGQLRRASPAEIEQATRDCQLAHVARYGKLPTERTLKLFRHSERVGRDYL
ncbi:hypothetical protein CEUSTIGMA_g3988.t1 [Chlamydomonas eustigma]|uniref:SET domain-containing protein n=1 Tax=Chlamydomonas eustigma TaxID=1157962 RepID=A0A250X0X7_9CHLO|nr:hypothetical protein CEUSTIGMA_g3988.t1 [Chlamydomonas eustigma]|eukprot:GAX76542.1 hypothetical protein CEUSTIGMA_g3988.t1 [Chlamydomonas eustigma]